MPRKKRDSVLLFFLEVVGGLSGEVVEFVFFRLSHSLTHSFLSRSSALFLFSLSSIRISGERDR
jgi:hypothetical protein